MKRVLNWLRNFLWGDRMPCGEYDVPGLEDWLERQARRGRVLRNWASFAEGVPSECRFCLEPAAKREYEPSDEKLADYAAAGWEYVCRTRGGAFLVWRSTSPDPVPLRTDPTADSYAYDYLWRRFLLQMALWLAYIIGMAGIAGYNLARDRHFLLNIMQNAEKSWLVVYLALVLGYIAFVQFSGLRTLRRLMRSLRAGVPMERRKSRIPFRTVYLLAACGIPLYLACGMLSVWEPEHVDLADDLTPFAAVDALGGTADGAKVTRFRTFLGRTVTVAQGDCDLLWRDSGRSTKDLIRIVCDTQQTVYLPYFPALSGPLLRELAEAYIPEDGGLPAETLDTDCFDDAFYVNSDGIQHFAARKDGRVLYCRTAAPEDLRDHLPELAAVLADTD